jgi:hypothetical protein
VSPAPGSDISTKLTSIFDNPSAGHAHAFSIGADTLQRFFHVGSRKKRPRRTPAGPRNDCLLTNVSRRTLQRRHGLAEAYSDKIASASIFGSGLRRVLSRGAGAVKSVTAFSAQHFERFCRAF